MEAVNFVLAWLLTPSLTFYLLYRIARDTRSSILMALLAALVSISALIRLMGAGFLGIEPIFFLIVLGGLALGANYGFLLGSLAILVSALLTAGIGPWLPVQMLGAGLVGLGAGWLKKLNHWLWISSYCLFASYLYGLLVTLFTWPLLAGDTSLGFSPTASLGENVVSYLNFAIFSGGLLWDTGRALTTVVLVLTTKEALLTALNRAVDRASVDLTKLAARSQVTEVPLR